MSRGSSSSSSRATGLRQSATSDARGSRRPRALTLRRRRSSPHSTRPASRRSSWTSRPGRTARSRAPHRNPHPPHRRERPPVVQPLLAAGPLRQQRDPQGLATRCSAPCHSAPLSRPAQPRRALRSTAPPSAEIARARGDVEKLEGQSLGLHAHLEVHERPALRLGQEPVGVGSRHLAAQLDLAKVVEPLDEERGLGRPTGPRETWTYSSPWSKRSPWTSITRGHHSGCRLGFPMSSQIESIGASISACLRHPDIARLLQSQP